MVRVPAVGDQKIVFFSVSYTKKKQNIVWKKLVWTSAVTIGFPRLKPWVWLSTIFYFDFYFIIINVICYFEYDHEV